MKRIQYEIKYKIRCRDCGHLGFPYIKMITFKNSKELSCAATCQKCGKWIENVPKQDVNVGKGKRKKK